MNNTQRILAFQYLPDYLNQIKQRAKNLFLTQESCNLSIIENIDHFKNEHPKTKHSLISLSPSAWLRAINEYPNIKFFNYVGLTFEMVKVLNENGFLVDIVDLNEEFTPTKNYDIFIGHGGKCRTIIDNLTPHTKILQYVSGAYWKLFYEESKERYEAFKKRKRIKENLFLKRNMDGLVEGEEYLTKKANMLFTLNCPRMIDSFGEYKKKFFFTGYGAYIDELLLVPPSEKHFEEGEKNFIYVGGSGGNIQKGMDLLLEAFIKTPELNLYIFCKVEDEILRYYKNELEAKNIHYIYHWRFSPLHQKLRQLVKRINFTIHAVHNSGIGTAFMGSMGAGFIPVGYIDLIAPKDSCVISESWDIDSLVGCVKEASGKSAAWCKNAAEQTIKNYEENFSVESFRNKFNELIRKIDEVPNM